MNFIKYLNKVDRILENRVGHTSDDTMMEEIEKAMDCGMDAEECVELLIKNFCKII